MPKVLDSKPWHIAKKNLFATNLGWKRTSKQPTQGSIIIPIHLPALNVLSSNATQGRIITLAVASSIAAARELTIHLLLKSTWFSDWEIGHGDEMRRERMGNYSCKTNKYVSINIFFVYIFDFIWPYTVYKYTERMVWEQFRERMQ